MEKHVKNTNFTHVPKINEIQNQECFWHVSFTP